MGRALRAGGGHSSWGAQELPRAFEAMQLLARGAVPGGAWDCLCH